MALVMTESVATTPRAGGTARMGRFASARPLPRREEAVIRRRLVDQVLTESQALHAVQVRLLPLFEAAPPGAPWPADVVEALDLLDATLSRLAAASDALDRLDAGTYGRCQGCDAAVPVPRLLASPSAPRCRACG